MQAADDWLADMITEGEHRDNMFICNQLKTT